MSLLQVISLLSFLHHPQQDKMLSAIPNAENGSENFSNKRAAKLRSVKRDKALFTSISYVRNKSILSVI